MRTLFLAIIFSIALASQAFAQTENYSEKIAEAEKLGRLIYDHDQAAWHGTDKLMEDMQKNGQIDGLKGWVTVPEKNGVSVRFIAERDGEYFSVWEALVRKSRVRSWERLDTPRVLTSDELALFYARQNTPIAEQMLCRDNLPLNTVVFPVPNDPEGRLYAYFFSLPKKPGDIVLGRHYRWTMSADGKTASDIVSYSNSCLVLNPSSQIPEGASPVAATATHIKTPYPQEHHVFANLAADLPLYISVSDPNALYEIKSGKITFKQYLDK